MKNKQKEWHRATKPLKKVYFPLLFLPWMSVYEMNVFTVVCVYIYSYKHI
jgi:hypothetical protein